jgi:hypothetical protein
MRVSESTFKRDCLAIFKLGIALFRQSVRRKIGGEVRVKPALQATVAGVLGDEVGTLLVAVPTRKVLPLADLVGRMAFAWEGGICLGGWHLLGRMAFAWEDIFAWDDAFA